MAKYFGCSYKFLKIFETPHAQSKGMNKDLFLSLYHELSVIRLVYLQVLNFIVIHLKCKKLQKSMYDTASFIVRS